MLDVVRQCRTVMHKQRQSRPSKTKTKMTSEIISIENLNSAGIVAEARRAGLSTVTKLGDNGKSGDARVTIYQLGDVRVADTNGDPVWEESDSATFAELLESEGISL